MAYQDQDAHDAERGAWQRLSETLRYPFAVSVRGTHGPRVVVAEALAADAIALRCRGEGGRCRTVPLSRIVATGDDVDGAIRAAIQEWSTAHRENVE